MYRVHISGAYRSGRKKRSEMDGPIAGRVLVYVLHGTNGGKHGLLSSERVQGWEIESPL